ncbi:MAG: Nin1 binding protein [Chaenotheca gracillima]|nr:MAG: Nin1 binding protein [Chaenotheca gracillima]
METKKRVHTLVLDAGPILKNEPSVSSLLSQSEGLVTVPSIISEIRDATARARIETTLLPFLTLRSPQSESLKLISEFARRTGDLEVLSRADIQILALAYEVECERNGGDWRLRSTPGQRRVNGSPPQKVDESQNLDVKESESQSVTNGVTETPEVESNLSHLSLEDPSESTTGGADLRANAPARGGLPAPSPRSTSIANDDPATAVLETPDAKASNVEPVSEEDSGSEGWITPSNIKRQQLKDANASAIPGPEQKVMQVATLTTDFAMQNVLLQMNLNLLSPSLQRVRHLKTYILRCHACFQKTKDMSKQFCPKCGKPTLTRVSCSTMENGEFKIHLKKNMQWNTRGDRYSIPKPVNGSSSGKSAKVRGGGVGAWGQDLVLAEDQKEYLRAMQGQKRQKDRDLMDEDYLPNILTGDRGRAGGRPKVGAGKNVNARKRK